MPLQVGMMFIRTSLRGGAGSRRSATSSEDDIYLHVTPGERGIPAKCHFKWGLYLSQFRPGRAGDPSEVPLQVAMVFITTSENNDNINKINDNKCNNQNYNYHIYFNTYCNIHCNTHCNIHDNNNRCNHTDLNINKINDNNNIDTLNEIMITLIKLMIIIAIIIIIIIIFISIHIVISIVIRIVIFMIIRIVVIIRILHLTSATSGGTQERKTPRAGKPVYPINNHININNINVNNCNNHNCNCHIYCNTY